jgi:hypothetical protein
MIEVPSGKQSADMHIGSYLGYLAGKKCKVVIVSRDTDYDNVIKFWKRERGLDVSRSSQIRTKKAKGKKEKDVPVPETYDTPKPTHSEVNLAVIRKLHNSELEINYLEVGQVASIAVRNLDKEDGKGQTKDAIADLFGKKRGKQIYQQIKDLI